VHVSGDAVVYDAVACAACGAKMREHRKVCVRCGARLAVAGDRPSRLPLRTFAAVACCLALVGVVATWGDADAPAQAARVAGAGNQGAPSAEGRGFEAAPAVDSREAVDPIANAAHPQDAEALNTLAQGLVRAGRAQEAIPHFDKAIQLAGDRWAYHFNRARAYGDLRDWDHAIEGYRAALQLSPEDYATAFNLARALDAGGRTAEAAAEYRRYLDLNPDEPSAEKIRARIALLEGTTSPRP
jgi:tetratricopeptide (TPR) repeat protein